MSCHYCGGPGNTLREHFSWCAIGMAEKEAQRLKLASIDPSDEGESSRTEPSENQDKSRHPSPARPADKIFWRLEDLDAKVLRKVLSAFTFASVRGGRFLHGAFHLPVTGEVPAGCELVIEEGKLLGVVVFDTRPESR